MDFESEKLRRVKELLEAIPKEFGFRLNLPYDGPIELRSNHCIIRISFERFEPSQFILEIVDPQNTVRGMRFTVLRHLRGVRDIQGDDPHLFRRIGTVLKNEFADLLNGDFSIRAQYDEVENRYFDRLGDVRALPKEHPIRVLYENYDLQWLTQIEKNHVGT